MPAVDEFAGQLRDLGFDVTITGSFVTFPFEIQNGGRSGQVVALGIEVPGDFPANSPPGPHVRPALGHPDGHVQPSPGLGADWQYWSRPFPSWPSTNRTASDYMAHVRLLFSQL
jgi:hypothetical protein